MKRCLALWCCGWLLWLTGCGSADQTNATPVTTGFSCQADIRYKDMTLTGTLSRSTAGTLELAFSSPDTLKGVVAEWDGETVKASLYGVSFDLPPDALPTTALGTALTEALDAAWRTPEAGQLTDEGWRWEGDGPNGNIVLLTDPADGSLLSLEVAQIPLSVSFSNFETTSR